jgi:ABC-2 type transport system permease protein
MSGPEVTMARGFWGLTWLELKIFVREPLGLIGSVLVPVLLFLAVGRLAGPRLDQPPPGLPRFLGADLPIFVALLVTASTMLSLVTILAIYREGGILKRLRATPLQPATILAAHVLVKLCFTSVTVSLMLLAGRRLSAVGADGPLASFVAALLLGTVSACSLGFLIASVVPTARFAQPMGALIVYPLIGLSGLFTPVADMPPALQAAARLSPFTYSVSLMKGIWAGEGWLAHAGDATTLVLMLAGFTALSGLVFRWE